MKGWVWMTALATIGAIGCAGDDEATPTPVGSDDVEADTSAGEPDVGPGDSDTTAVEAGTYQISLQSWTVGVGEEVTRCAVVELGNDAPIQVGAIQTTLAKGSHHLIVYKTDQELTAEPYECEPFTDTLISQPLMISEIGAERLELPDGVALPIPAGQRILLEAHYLNYYAEPIEASATVTFETRKPEEVEHTAGIALLGTSVFNALPGQASESPWVWIDMPNGSKVYALTGHTHQWGTNVEVQISQGRFEDGDSVYPPDGEPFKWNEAPIAKFSPALELASGQGIRFKCHYMNESDSPVGFGLSANEEMCIVWAYYYPSEGYELCVHGIFPDCGNDNGPNGSQAPPGPVLAQLKLWGKDGTLVSDALVKGGVVDVYSDSAGDAWVPLQPSAPFELEIIADGYITNRAFGFAVDQDFSWSVSVLDEDRYGEIHADAGVAINPEAGSLAVGLLSPPEFSAGLSATVDLDYETATVRDAEGETHTGSTILEGGPGWVTFLNTTPGETTPQPKPPEGMECMPAPGGGPQDTVPVTVYAGEASMTAYWCNPTN